MIHISVIAVLVNILCRLHRKLVTNRQVAENFIGGGWAELKKMLEEIVCLKYTGSDRVSEYFKILSASFDTGNATVVYER